MANREEGAAIPNQRQGQEQPSSPGCSQTKAHTFLTGQTLSQNFQGKPEEDAEAHLLHSNDWMEAHYFDFVKMAVLCVSCMAKTGQRKFNFR